MGIGVIVHGVIKWPLFDRMVEGEAGAINRRVIQELPLSDPEWPFITRGMFSMLPVRTSLDECIAQYETQVIHFAGEYKNRFLLEAAWVCKFERLLSRLIWTSATVMVDFTGLVYTWRVPHDYLPRKLDLDAPLPPTQWTLECHRVGDTPIPLAEAIDDEDGEYISPYHTPEGGAA